FFHHSIHPLPCPTLFPYTTLFRSFCLGKLPQQVDAASIEVGELLAFSYLDRALCEMPRIKVLSLLLSKACLVEQRVGEKIVISQDRKSTRLNSSHLGISYAVFCLK